jgi:LPXTG-site transpeptidase (sortase) family protein
MHVHSPRPVRHLARALSLALACIGLVGILVSGGILLDTWYARWTWARSEQAQQIARLASMTSPASVEPEAAAPQVAPDGGDRPPEPTARAVLQPSTPAMRRQQPVLVPTFVESDRPVLDAPGTSGAKALEVLGAELRVLDPPGAGAHARLSVTIRNHSNVPTQPVVLGIPAAWFDRFDIIGATPPVLDDHAEDDGFRYFDFPGAASGTDATLELDVVSADGDESPPTVRLALRDGDSLGELQASTATPPAPAGPLRMLSVPRLGIHTGVVGTGWEPPPFVAGQIRTTAALGEGNSVVVGHRGGRAGDVFARLAGARRGDDVLAVTDGEEHRYTVTDIRILPGDDITPIRPTETARLTLMTCIGAWNPLTGEYSHRLWVIAEPPDEARAGAAPSPH